MKMMHWSMMVVFTFAIITQAGCGEDPTERQKRQARNILGNTCRLISLVETESKQKPPLKLSKLVDWIAENEYCERFVDERNRTIRDPWGSAIIIIARQGRLKSLASKGPNRKWENGKGDDIIVSARDIRLR